MERPLTHTIWLVVLSALVSLTLSASGPLSSNDTLPYHATLDGNFQLQWNFNVTHILFRCRVRTAGYLGFGISAHGGMFPADVVIAWMDGDQPHFHDRYAKAQKLPEIDVVQDWTLLELKREDASYLSMTVVRKLNTCDEKEDLPIQEGTTRVIYSYSDAMPTSDVDIQYHGADSRGSKSLLLLDPPPSDDIASHLPSDVTTHDFLNNKYKVPAKDTTYSCILTKFQPPGGKHHLIRYEPVIQPGHEKLVHHMLLYTCNKPVPDDLLGVPFECYSHRPSEVGDACDFVMVAWAIGGKTFDYPSHVGHSLGTASDPVYFKLETHYDNVDKVDDMVDSSGLRMYLTKQLRQHDAGMLEVGTHVDEFHIIPPQYPAFLTRGHCVPQCLEAVVGDKGIKVFADMLHSHLIGRKLQTRHVRNGVELPPIMKDDNYDFDYQESRLLNEERVVKKGDTLMTDCIYDSSKRYTITYGGLSSRMEMCLSFILYYPRTNLNNCLSRLIYAKNGEPMYEDRQILNTTYWSNKDNRDKFAENVKDSDILASCVYEDTQKNAHFQIRPRAFDEYQPDDGCPGGRGMQSAISCHVTVFCACVFSFVLSRFTGKH